MLRWFVVVTASLRCLWMVTQSSSEVRSARWAYYLPVGRLLTQSGHGSRGDISATRGLGGSEPPPNNRMQQTVRPVTSVAWQRPGQAVPQLTLKR